MSNFANMNYSVGMNTADADKQRQQFEQRSIEGSKKISQQQQIQYNLINRLADRLNRKVEMVGKKWAPVAIAVGATTVAIGGTILATQKLVQLSERLAAAQDRRNSFLNMGGDQETINKVNAALNNTVDRMTTLTALRDLRLMQGTNKDIENAAKMAALLAKRMGDSKASMLTLVSQGALTEEHFNAIGTSAAIVNQKLSEMETASGRTLEGSERKIAMIRIALGQASKSSNGFTQNTAKAGDKFAQIRKRIDDLLLQIGKKLLPFSLKVLEAFDGWLDGVKIAIEETQRWAKILYELPGKATAYFSKMFSFVSIQFRKVKALVLRQHDQFKALQREQKRLFDKQEEQRQKVLKRRIGIINALEKASANMDKKAKERGSKVSVSGKRGVSDEARERINEQRAFQLEALNRIRNFSTFALDLASNIGGPVSGVLSALKDYTEQLRIFRAKFGSKFIEQTQGKSIKQLKEMFKTDKARLRAAILLNMSRKAGLLDIKEYVINEKIAALQLKAQIAPNQQIAGLIQNRVERLNIEKDVQGSIKAIKFAEKALEHAKTKEERKGLQFILEKAKQYPKIRAQRLAILAISDKEHKNSLAAAKAQAALDRQSANLTGREKLLGLQLQLAEAQGQNTGQTKLAQIRLQQQQAQLAISQKQAELQSQTNKLATGRLKVGTEEYNQQLLKIQGLKSEIEVLGQVADLQRRIAHAQMNPKISAIAVQHAQQFGQQLAQNLGGNVASIFETIFTGGDMGETMAKIGLSIMNVLGDTLIAAGVQTMLMGIASLVNPFLGANPGAIAVGGGMILAGGLLKGGAAAAAAGMAERGGSAGSRSRVAEPRTPANTRNQQQQSVTNIYNMSDPYFEGNMSRRVGNLQRQLNRHGTSTGVSLNPRMIRGGR